MLLFLGGVTASVGFLVSRAGTNGGNLVLWGRGYGRHFLPPQVSKVCDEISGGKFLVIWADSKLWM